MDLPPWKALELDYTCEMLELKEVFSVSSLSFSLVLLGRWDLESRTSSLGAWIINSCSLLFQSDDGPPPAFALSLKALSEHKPVSGLNMDIVVSTNV